MKNAAFNEETITRYLLGDLPETKQVEIEDRAFQDKECLDSILAVENDLIDEYARGELSDSERFQFERRFLASAERRQKVDFARALASVVSEVPGDQRTVALTPAWTSLRDSLVAFVRGLSPAMQFSLAFAALLMVIFGSWLMVATLRLRTEVEQLRAEQQSRQREQQDLNQRVDTERKRSEELAGQLQREQQERQANEQIISELQREKENSAKQSIRAIVSLALLPGISRSSNARPQLALPGTARLVRLQIGIDPEDRYKNFRVELRGPGGQQVLTRDGLSAHTTRAGRAIILSFPANMLSTGRYELTLKGSTGSGNTEDVGYYYFDVLKK
jgi:hypothetical protein